MPYIDPQKAKENARERKRRYLRKLKIAKYGELLADVDLRGRHGKHAHGNNHPRWNTGTLKTSQGYALRRVPPDHPRAFGPSHSKQKYAYEHDVLMEAVLGRQLRDDEVVHHKNGVRDDNCLENLEITTRSKHAAGHVRFPGARNYLGQFTNGPRSGGNTPS